jgi:hypothetical protein
LSKEEISIRNNTSPLGIYKAFGDLLSQETGVDPSVVVDWLSSAMPRGGSFRHIEIECGVWVGRNRELMAIQANFKSQLMEKCLFDYLMERNCLVLKLMAINSLYT